MLTALKTILAAAAKSLGVERAAYAAMIEEVWATVVGVEAAAATRPSGLRGDILWVDVEPGPEAQDFALQRMKVVAALNAHLGGAVIRDIRVRQQVGVARRVQAPRPAVAPQDTPPLSPDELARIDRLAEEIPDGELRAAAKRAMVSQWRWRKRTRRSGEESR